MNTQTSVATVRSLYERLASSPEAFLSELNEVTNRLMNADLWHGCTDNVLFGLSNSGYIVLPQHFISVLGYTINDIPRPVFSQFHEYIEHGIGWQDVSEMGTFGLLDAGMVVTQVEISGTVTLRVKITSATDAGKVIRFYGLDQNSQPIVDSVGVEGTIITAAYPSADGSQQFTALTGIQVPVNMVGRWTLWALDSNGAETQIGTYQPGELAPSYRRYKVGIRTDQDVIRCFCRRQWVRAWNETDWIFPGCLSAIKMGFKALQLEDANKYADSSPSADDQWGRAFTELDKELSVLRGYTLPSLRIFGFGNPRVPVIVN